LTDELHRSIEAKAVKELGGLPKPEALRVADALERLKADLRGDVKRLTNFSPEYRLRVGSYRVLFEIEDATRVVVYRILHRREAYR